MYTSCCSVAAPPSSGAEARRAPLLLGAPPLTLGSARACSERKFCMVRIHFIIVKIKWTGLALWGFEIPVPGSLTSTFLVLFGCRVEWLGVRVPLAAAMEEELRGAWDRTPPTPNRKQRMAISDVSREDQFNDLVLKADGTPHTEVAALPRCS